MEVPKLLLAYQELVKSSKLSSNEASQLKVLTLQKQPQILALAKLLDQPNRHHSSAFISALKVVLKEQSDISTDAFSLERSSTASPSTAPMENRSVTYEATSSHAKRQKGNVTKLSASSKSSASKKGDSASANEVEGHQADALLAAKRQRQGRRMEREQKNEEEL